MPDTQQAKPETPRFVAEKGLTHKAAKQGEGGTNLKPTSLKAQDIYEKELRLGEQGESDLRIFFIFIYLFIWLYLVLVEAM